jgi:hypothetical protein
MNHPWTGLWGHDSPVPAGSKTLTAVVLLLTLPMTGSGWVLLAPDPHGRFDSAAACLVEVTAWNELRGRGGGKA